MPYAGRRLFTGKQNEKFKRIAAPFVDRMARNNTISPFIRAFFISPFSRKYASEIMNDRELLYQIQLSGPVVNKAMSDLYFKLHELKTARNWENNTAGSLRHKLETTIAAFNKASEQDAPPVELTVAGTLSLNVKYFCNQEILGHVVRALLEAPCNDSFPSKITVRLSQKSGFFIISVPAGRFLHAEFKALITRAFENHVSDGFPGAIVFGLKNTTMLLRTVE